jgi:hypothetical protein
MKKNMLLTVEMLVMVLTFGLVLAGCDNGSTSSSEWWEGRYTVGSYWVEISTHGLVSSTGDSQTGSVTISVKQGDVMYNSQDIGDWVYIYGDGNLAGIVINVTGHPTDNGQGIGVANTGVTNLLADIIGGDGDLSPQPLTTGYTDPGYWFYGYK